MAERFRITVAAQEKLRDAELAGSAGRRLAPTLIFASDPTSGDAGWTLGFHDEDTLVVARRTAPDRVIKIDGIEIMYEGKSEPWQTELSGVTLDWDGQEFILRKQY